jgi:Ulp1 family protease
MKEKKNWHQCGIFVIITEKVKIENISTNQMNQQRIYTNENYTSSTVKGSLW